MFVCACLCTFSVAGN